MLEIVPIRGYHDRLCVVLAHVTLLHKKIRTLVNKKKGSVILILNAGSNSGAIRQSCKKPFIGSQPSPCPRALHLIFRLLCLARAMRQLLYGDVGGMMYFRTRKWNTCQLFVKLARQSRSPNSILIGVRLRHMFAAV